MPDTYQPASEPTILSGSIYALLQFDVCEEIRLDRLRHLLSAPTLQHPALKHPAPGYVRYKRPPVVEPTQPLALESGESLQGEIKYYDYGVVSVVFQLAFSSPWQDLIALTSRWAWEIDFAARAEHLVRERLKIAEPALIKRYTDWLSEDYLTVHVERITDSPDAAELIARDGSRIAQVVRGDPMPLSIHECNEVLQSSISYYPTDLAVIGWNAAFVYDTPSGAEAAIQLLEYAN
ncbi:MAG TPA: hypothetical protein VFS41_06965, partial [Edaphobacter sp.]|nr:hypothetical protein [Edaphobacter sp.]